MSKISNRAPLYLSSIALSQHISRMPLLLLHWDQKNFLAKVDKLSKTVSGMG